MAAGEPGRLAGGTLGSPPREGGWAEDQVAELRQTVDRLERELAGVRTVLQEQQRTASELQSALQAVEGRARRQVTGEEIVRRLQQQLDGLVDRIEEEAALRRDQRAAIEREHDREREGLQAGEVAIGELGERVRTLEQRVLGLGERQRQLIDDASAADRTREHLDERVADAESRVAAMGEAWTNERDERARFESTVPELATALDELDARTIALRTELRRSEDSVARLGSRRDREDELFELVDQQRSTRARVEERLGELERRIEEGLQLEREAREERAGLNHELTALAAQVRALGESQEGQRLALLDHFRRLVEADEARDKEQIGELEQRIRVGRRLMAQLNEGSRQAHEEQPL